MKHKNDVSNGFMGVLSMANETVKANENQEQERPLASGLSESVQS
jgi:hypothetical protein